MKKTLTILVALVLVLTACGQKETDATVTTAESVTSDTIKEKTLPGEAVVSNPIHMTDEEKQAGWKIFPDMGVKFFLDKKLWKDEGAYLFSNLIGNTENVKNPIYAGVYYYLVSPYQNDELNDLYTRKDEMTTEEFLAAEEKIRGEMPGLFAIVTVRSAFLDDDVMKMLGFDEKEVLFEDVTYRTLFLTSKKDDAKADEARHPEISQSVFEDKEVVLNRYHRFLDDVKTSVRPSLVAVRPLTLAEALRGLDLRSMSVIDLDGKKMSLGEVIGKNTVTMVNVWATFCPPCKAELADIAKAHDSMAEKGAAVVGIIGDVRSPEDASHADAMKLLEDAHASYPNLLRTKETEKIIEYLAGYPTTFFVNREGTVIGPSFVGSRDLEEFTRTMEDLLGK